MFNVNKTPYLIALIALSSFSTLASAKSLFPHGCLSKGYEFAYHTLKLHPEAAGSAQSLYLVYNQSKHNIKLYQLRASSSPFIMNLNNTIKARQWGAFATDEKQTRFACTTSKYGSEHGQIIDCKQVLKVCEFTRVKFGGNHYGNYWVVDSSSKNTTLRKAIKHGILLRSKRG